MRLKTKAINMSIVDLKKREIYRHSLFELSEYEIQIMTRDIEASSYPVFHGNSTELFVVLIL